MAGVALFLLTSTVHGALVPGFEWWHQSVSALALAAFGWIQTVNFFVLGGSILCAVPAWRRLLRGGRGAMHFSATAFASGFLRGIQPRRQRA